MILRNKIFTLALSHFWIVTKVRNAKLDLGTRTRREKKRKCEKDTFETRQAQDKRDSQDGSDDVVNSEIVTSRLGQGQPINYVIVWEWMEV